LRTQWGDSAVPRSPVGPRSVVLMGLTRTSRRRPAGREDDLDDLVGGGVVEDDAEPRLRHEVDQLPGAVSMPPICGTWSMLMRIGRAIGLDRGCGRSWDAADAFIERLGDGGHDGVGGLVSHPAGGLLQDGVDQVLRQAAVQRAERQPGES